MTPDRGRAWRRDPRRRSQTSRCGAVRRDRARLASSTRCCCSAARRSSDQDLIAFSRRFGDLDWAPIQETGRRFVEGLPEIYIVSNVMVNGEPIGSLGAGEAVWHTDMSYLDVPPMASMLYALEVPPTGGNTSFCSMYAVYEALPDGVEAAHREPDDQARRHLQQRRLSAPGRHRDRRSADLAGRGASAGLHPSRHRPARCSISAAAATPI